MPTTQQLRDAWSPACTSKNRQNIEQAYQALDSIFKKYAYRPLGGETWGANCRPITGGSGYSLHAYRDDSTFTFWTGVRVAMAIAVDINSRANPYGPRLITDMPRPMIDEIMALRTNSGHAVWGWGGYYSDNKDAMHFELNCFPDQLATGVRFTAPAPNPVPEPVQPQEDDDMPATIYKNEENGVFFKITDNGLRFKVSAATAAENLNKNKDGSVRCKDGGSVSTRFIVENSEPATPADA